MINLLASTLRRSAEVVIRPTRRRGKLVEIERRAIVATLRMCEGNREKAARELGIGQRTLYRKIKEYGLKRRLEKS